MAFGIILAIIGGIMLLLILCCCKTIRIAIAVVKQSMICVGKIPIIFLFPVITLIFVLIHIAWTAAGSYLMYLTGSYDSSTNLFNFYKYSRDSNFNLIKTWDYMYSSYFASLVFAAIWGVFFFYNMLEYIISAMVA